MFNKLDELFFHTILLNKQLFDDMMDKTIEYKLNLTKDIVQLRTSKIDVEYDGKTKKHIIILFGLYDKIGRIYKWMGQTNELLAEQLMRYDVEDIFGTYQTIDKIFSSEFTIANKEHLAIPYLMAILNPAFNLIRFESEDGSLYFYALVNLGIKDNFIFEKFISDMTIYKNLALANKVSANTSNKGKISRQSIKKKDGMKHKTKGQ
jgi:hypothetical protein